MLCICGLCIEQSVPSQYIVGSFCLEKDDFWRLAASGRMGQCGWSGIGGKVAPMALRVGSSVGEATGSEIEIGGNWV